MILGPAQVAPFTLAGGDELVVAQSAILHGWSLLETSGVNPARVDLHDGPTGPRICPFSLCAGESARDWLSGAGIYAITGLYFKVISGTVDGTLWYRPATSKEHMAPLDPADLLDQLLDGMFDARR